MSMQAQADTTIRQPARRWSWSLSWPLSLVAVAVALLFGATAALWGHYGTAVFYETILAGIAACM